MDAAPSLPADCPARRPSVAPPLTFHAYDCLQAPFDAHAARLSAFGFMYLRRPGGASLPLAERRVCYIARMSAPSTLRSPLSTQLELPLNITPSPSFGVSRLPSGHVVLTPRALDLWISTVDAARMMRRSSRWVRMLCDAGVIRARQLPRSKRWDVDAIALQEWINSGRNT